MVCRTIVLLVAKLRYAVVGRVETAKETCAIDTIELHQIALNVCLDHYVCYAATVKSHLCLFQFSLAGTVLNVVLRLCCLVATFQPVAFAALFRRNGNACIAH